MGGNKVMFSPRPAPRATVTQLPVTLVHASRRNQGTHAPRKQATRYDDECEKTALQTWRAPWPSLSGTSRPVKPETDDEPAKPFNQPRFVANPGPAGTSDSVRTAKATTAGYSDHARASPQGVERDQATGRLRIDGGLLPRGQPAWERATLGVHELVRERATLLGPAQPDVEQDRSPRPPARPPHRHHHEIHRPSGRDLPHGS